MLMTASPQRKAVKCLVWDLDHTLWDGVLLEGDQVRPFAGVPELVRELDRRGILQSIASKNDPEPALARLEQLGLKEYFLYPQIHWGNKSTSVQRIAERLNIGTDAIAFIDDTPFELDEVKSMHPHTLCINSELRPALADMAEFQPRVLTDETAMRRRMYLDDAARQDAEEAFEGPREEFLASLDMRLTLRRAEEADLDRLEELVARTNQLNTTGRIYSRSQLDAFRTSAEHDFWVAALSDIYGDYGKIGLALVSKQADAWTIQAFLMSCRVMTRGVGSVFIQWLQKSAQQHQVALRAELIPNERNRMMIATYRFGGFQPAGKDGAVDIYQHPLTEPVRFPDYVALHAP